MLKNRVSSLLSLMVVGVLALSACGPAATTEAPTSAPAATEAPAATSAPAPTEAPTAAPTEAPTAAPTEAPTAAPSSASNTLVYDKNMDDLITLDPGIVYEFSGILVVHNVYQTLLQFEGTDISTLKPGLAQKWDVKDAGDHWEVTFTLVDGVKFASGNPLTADDVVYSVQRVIGLNKSPAFLFTDVAGLKPDSIKAADPKTVVFSLPKTASPQSFLSIMTNTVSGVVDSKEVKTHEANGDFGSGWLLDHSAGSGPYAIDHWTKGTEILITANPNWGGDKPALTSILFKQVPDAANQQTALQQGDADIADGLGAEQIAALKGQAGLTTASGDALYLYYIGMNAKFKPLDNVKVREAMRMAIDYNGIVKDLLSGNGKVVQTIIPAGFLGFNPDTPFQQDVEKAKALLTEGGQPNGFTAEMLVPTGNGPGGVAFADLAAKLQSDWAKIGVTVNIKQEEFGPLLTTYRAQKAQIAMVYWGPDFPDPDTNVTPFTTYAAKSLAYRNGWDDKISVKAAAAAVMTDPAARAAAYKDITDYVLHNGPYAILYQPTQLFALRDTVKGFVWNGLGWADLWKVSK
jgi:peptide/nickel transport system substrate-binding protein